jgi:catechol 2,3-dioxygenase-like lactoylglutathione lyase family enzyme
MKLSHVAIGCADLEKVAAFYVETLEFKEAFRVSRDDGSLWIIYLDAGCGTFIELLARGGEVDALPKTGLSHICLSVESMEAELARLAGLGVAPENPPKRASDGNLQAWVTDPEGNRVELMELSPEGKQLKYLNK